MIQWRSRGQSRPRQTLVIMKHKSKSNVQSIATTLWNAVTGPRPQSAMANPPPKLATDGGRRRFIRLQLRINEVLGRIDELQAELRGCKDEHRAGRLQSMLNHQAERGTVFMDRFEQMMKA